MVHSNELSCKIQLISHSDMNELETHLKKITNHYLNPPLLHGNQVNLFLMMGYLLESSTFHVTMSTGLACYINLWDVFLNLVNVKDKFSLGGGCQSFQKDFLLFQNWMEVIFT